MNSLSLSNFLESPEAVNGFNEPILFSNFLLISVMIWQNWRWFFSECNSFLRRWVRFLKSLPGWCWLLSLQICRCFSIASVRHSYQWLGFRRRCISCRGIRYLSQSRGIQGMTLNYTWWRGSCFENQENES